jgi:hypothetical protein
VQSSWFQRIVLDEVDHQPIKSLLSCLKVSEEQENSSERLSLKNKKQIFKTIFEMIRQKKIKMNKNEVKFIHDKTLSFERISEVEEWLGYNSFSDAPQVLRQIKEDLIFFINKCNFVFWVFNF